MAIIVVHILKFPFKIMQSCTWLTQLCHMYFDDPWLNFNMHTFIGYELIDKLLLQIFLGSLKAFYENIFRKYLSWLHLLKDTIKLKM